jgi:SAM-dependent methyltransferase
MSTDNDNYRRLFDLYTKHANGKRKVANAIIDLIEARNVRSVIDVGAGNGFISAQIAPFVDFLHVIEPNDEFHPALKEVEKRARNEYRMSDIRAEDIGPDEYDRYDLVLLSYVLESLIPGTDVRAVCRKMLDLRRAGGTFIGVTYVDGCAWDAYSTIVERRIRTPQRGGLSRVVPMLRSLGFNVRTVTAVRTEIWGRNLEDLFRNIAFFHRRAEREYFDSAAYLLPELRKLSRVNGGGRVVLDVDELIYEVTDLGRERETPDHGHPTQHEWRASAT